MSDPLTGLGVVSDILGIVDFIEGLFPDNAPDTGTTVRIKAGLGDDDSSELGGTINAVYAFDSNNDYLGDSISGSMGAGDYADFIVRQNDPGRRGDYVSIDSSDDAVCIAWITVTMEDMSAGGGWSGDIGYFCGQPWYYGNQKAGEFESDHSDWLPRCSWIDGDGTSGFMTKAFKFTSDAYGNDVQDTLDTNAGCTSTIFSTDSGPVPDVPAGKPEKRAITGEMKRPAKTEGRLIVSKHSQHTAEALCNHPNSLGPDFIGSDHKSCDMERKILYPLCSSEGIDGCVQLSNNTLTKRTSVAKRTADIVHKDYRLVSTWE